MLENFDDTSTALSEFDYDYSVAGLRESETLLDGRQRNFAYDDYYQVEQADLEVANSSYDFQYSYDDIGNRLSARDDTVTTTYTANSLNQYDTISGLANPTYDANGSLLAHDGDSYTWNEENRLSRVDKSDGSYVTFLYDGLGRRISKKSYNSSSVLVADTLFEYTGFTIVREEEAANSEVKQYTIGNDLANALSGTGGIGAILAMHDGTNDYYYFYDGNYNVSQVVDASSSVVAEYGYSPYGEAIVETGALASDNPIRFSSKYFDKEVGMLYYGFRYYSPELGRWPSRDPIGERGSLNLYSFVRNSQYNWIDLYGLQPMSSAPAIPGSNAGSLPRGGGVASSVWIIAQFWQGLNSLRDLVVDDAIADAIGAGQDGESIRRWINQGRTNGEALERAILVKKCVSLYNSYDQFRNKFNENSCRSATTCKAIKFSIKMLRSELRFRNAYIRNNCDRIPWKNNTGPKDHKREILNRTKAMIGCLLRFVELCGCSYEQFQRSEANRIAKDTIF